MGKRAKDSLVYVIVISKDYKSFFRRDRNEELYQTGIGSQ
jgi:hypothetical protein